MKRGTTRRDFLQTASTGGVFLGFGGLEFLAKLPPVSAADLQPVSDVVPLEPDILPLVRLLEETPRAKLLERGAERIHQGVTYRQLLAALLLAGVRNIQPRPSVGFKFHAVLVVNSVHLAAMASPEHERWLPLFWALDYFKDSQARDEREGNWTMRPVRESKLPQADRAAGVFVDAMERWDVPAADVAIAALARSADRQSIFELFYRLGSRDFRSIGHKAIYVANAQRVLEFIGWKYAEPVLRSLAYALLMHEDGNPAERDAEADRPWRQNQELVTRIKADLKGGRPDDGATADLLATFREGTFDDAVESVIAQLNQGIAPQSVWDAIFCGSGELLLRQPGIVALHSVTTTNAIHYAYRATDNVGTQQLLLLQNAAFLPMFREAMRGRGRVADRQIDHLEQQQPAGRDAAAVEDILAEVPRNRAAAVEKTLGYFAEGGEAEPLLSAARRLLLLKGNDAHDYKFGSAVLEDYASVGPNWRNRFLAACMMHLCGAGEDDSRLVERTRAAV